MERRKVGVDFGYDRWRMVSRKNNGDPFVILNRAHEHDTPSAVARLNGEWVIGRHALELAPRHPQAVAQGILAYLSEGRPLQLNGETFSPDEVLRAVLTRLREDAENRLGESVGEAVIAVPPDLTREHLETIRAMAAEASWPQTSVVPGCAAAVAREAESTDAAQAYLVLDWNRDAFNASILLVGNGRIILLGSMRTPQLGLARFRDAVSASLLERVQAQLDVDGRNQPKFLAFLHDAVERAILQLCSQDSARIDVIGALKGVSGDTQDVELVLTRDELEKLISPAIVECLETAHQLLTEMNLAPAQLAGVRLTSSAVFPPIVGESVGKRFGPDVVIESGHNECVAIGALYLLEGGEDSIQVSRAENPLALIEEHSPSAPVAPASPEDLSEDHTEAEENTESEEEPEEEPEAQEEEAIPQPEEPETPPEAQAEEQASEDEAIAPSESEVSPDEEGSSEEPSPETEPEVSEPAAAAVQTSPERPAEESAPAPWARYKLVQQLFKETHYSCYLAEDERTGRSVRVRAYPTDDERAKRLFARALTAAHLAHPNIESILDVEAGEEALLLVAEGVGRVSLRDMMRERSRAGQPLPHDHALKIALDLCEALRAIHARGIFHRNIKPENILVGEDGSRAQLTGFEICRLLPRGHYSHSLAGTPPYIAPEVLRGRADCRADLYSAAVVIYEMITGRVPFRESNLERLEARLLSEVPPPLMSLNPSVSRELNGLIMAGLDKDPARRRLDVGDFRALLKRGAGLAV